MHRLVVRQSIAVPLQASLFQEFEVPRFQDNRHMKVVKLSALRTGHLYPPGNIPGVHTVHNYITNAPTYLSTSAPSSGSVDIVFAKVIKS